MNKELVQEIREDGKKYEPNSSTIKTMTYHPERMALIVDFKSGGSYLYTPVTHEVWEEILKSESAGKMFHEKIKKTNTPWEKLEAQQAGSVDPGLMLGVVAALIISFVLLGLVRLAAAHPVDDLCAPGKVTEDGCQPVTDFLCLDDPEFYRAHRAYWHCRRLLVTQDTVAYAMLAGRALEVWGSCKYPKGITFPFIDWGLLSYWDRIPAHPELDFQCAAWRAEEQRLACEATRGAAAAGTARLYGEIEKMRSDCRTKPNRRRK